MTVLTAQEIRRQFGPSSKDVKDFYKNHPKLPRPKRIPQRIRDRILASKLAKTPGKEASFTQSAAEWQIIYGQVKVGGVITFVGRSGPDHRYLHIVVTIAGHEIQSIDKLFLDDQEVIFGASPDPRWSTGVRGADGVIVNADHKIFLSPTVGDIGQATNPDLNASLPAKWTSLHTQDGCAYAYIILEWDGILFPSGPPEISFLVSGKPCYLPDTTTAYTANAAAIVADYLTDTRYGLGISWDSIDLDQYQAAYDICAESVPITGSAGSESRYLINGVFKVSESPQEILDTMCAAMGGCITFVGGLWKIYPAAYRAPTISLTEDDLLGDIRVQTKLSRKDSFNGVRGTFISPSDDYEETDFPAVRNSFYVSDDNGEVVWEDVQYPVTTSSAAAQRLAKIELERNRQSITVQATFGLRAYQVEPMDTIMLTLPRLGWTSKIFEVQQLTLVLEGGDPPAVAVQMLLRETGPAVFDWNLGLETSYDISSNTDLPSPRVAPGITGVTLSSGTDELYIRSDGTVFTRLKVSWDEPEDFFVTSGGAIQVIYRKFSDPDWIYLSYLPGNTTSTYILDVQDLEVYEVCVRAINALRVAGEYSSPVLHTVLGKSVAPSAVTGFTGVVNSYGILFKWDKIPDLDVAGYQIRQGAIDGNWNDGTQIFVSNGQQFQSNIQPIGNYKFMIKAIDTSGNESVTEAVVALNVQGPTAPVITGTIEDINAVLSWSASVGQFAIDRYEMREGATFETGFVVGTTKSTEFKERINWVGPFRFWVVALDVAGNYGTPSFVDITVNGPAQPQAIIGQVVDNNINIKWTEPLTGTLEIDHYRVFRGDSFSTAIELGSVSATFATFFETNSGFYTYWIVPVDKAGNEGTPGSTRVYVNSPPDFVIVSDAAVDGNGATLYNCYIDGTDLVATAYTEQTYAQHFSNNGWSTIQDKVDAGILIYAQPTPSSGYFERVIDAGTLLPGCTIRFSFVRRDVSGNMPIVVRLATSVDGVTYTAYTQGDQIFSTEFRYIKIRLDFGTVVTSQGRAIGLFGFTQSF